MSATTNTTPARVLGCACARNLDGTAVALLCPIHADNDPCSTVARVTGKRRRGSVMRGCCSHCGWQEHNAERDADWLATYSLYCD